MKNNKMLLIVLIFLTVMTLVSACASPNPSHGIRPRGWEITDNLVEDDQNVRVSVLQVVVAPKHITLICVISGLGEKEVTQGLSLVDSKVSVFGENDKMLGQAKVTEIERFPGGSLIAITYLGNRQGTLKPRFSIQQVVNHNDNQVIDGQWEIAPVEMFSRGSDQGGMFATGIESVTIGDVTIFAQADGQSYNPETSAQAQGFFGGPENVAAFSIKVKQSGQIYWLYLLVTGDGQVSKITEDEYLQIPSLYK